MSVRLFRKAPLSLLHILAIAILLVVNVWNFAVHFNALRGKSLEQIEFQKSKTEMVLLYLPKFLENGQERLSIDYIELGKINNFYDFFVIKKNGQPLANTLDLENLDTRFIREGVLHQEIKGPEQTYYISKKTMGPYEVVLGYFPANNSIFTGENVKTVLKANAIDSLIFFIAIVLLPMNGFFKQTRLILSGKLHELEKMNPLTVEGKLLKNLFIHASNLTKREIDSEVPDGVEVELSRGTKVGEPFDAVMFRIDFNDYTPLTQKYGSGVIDTVLSPIFSEYLEIAQRYSFYEVADEGDQRAFYSRNEDGFGHRRALSAIRAMFDVAKLNSPNYFEKFGFELKFKAGIALSPMHLMQVGRKIKMKGDAFTFSSRCVNIFKDRTEKEFVISIFNNDFPGLETLAPQRVVEEYKIDGLGLHDLVFISNFQQRPLDKSQIQYYLANTDITMHLKDLLNSWDIDTFWTLNHALKTFTSHIKDQEHEELLMSLLKKAEIIAAGDQAVVASLLTMASKLISKKHLSEESLQTIKSFLQSPNNRVRANALEALGELGIFISESVSFLQSPDNRIRANALVLYGKSDIGSTVQQSLLELLNSDHDADVLSGLYTVDQLFKHYESHNLTLFKTATFFPEITRNVRLLLKNRSSIIKEKAQQMLDCYGLSFKEDV